ncbi:uncharacterized protein LOC128883711 [Hylaeus volcanicus]|uniref:uncharacterized protein LOC128883711 n=1 Tax=Hylaeus volcanicus TaxID=313075 RepID=UPI0023B82AF0|nr:uncharacterized protein LOC128883711 [Hylaeus volcanicus]
MQRLKDCLNNIKLQSTFNVETKSQSNEKIDINENVLKAPEIIDQEEPSSYLALDEISSVKSIRQGIIHRDTPNSSNFKRCQCLETPFNLNTSHYVHVEDTIFPNSSTIYSCRKNQNYRDCSSVSSLSNKENEPATFNNLSKELWASLNEKYCIEENLVFSLYNRSFREVLDSVIITFNTLGPIPSFVLLKKNGLLDPTSSEEIAAFLFFTQGLEKSRIGKFLSIPDDFNTEVVKHFLRFFDFKNVDLVSALRLFFSKFQPPGESQQLLRFVNAFSNAYVNDNSTVDMVPDTIAYLAYAILMLHTDQHNTKVRQKMTKDAFVKLLLTKDEKPAQDKKFYNSDLPLIFTRKYLEGVYDNVVTSEFRLFYTERDLLYSRLSKQEYLGLLQNTLFNSTLKKRLSNGTKHESLINEVIKKGVVFVKYCRTGTLRLRQLKVSDDEASLEWFPFGQQNVDLLGMKNKKIDRSIALVDIEDVTIEYFSRRGKIRGVRNIPEFCCTIYSTHRKLVLCESVATEFPLQAWASIILAISQRLKCSLLNENCGNGLNEVERVSNSQEELCPMSYAYETLSSQRFKLPPSNKEMHRQSKRFTASSCTHDEVIKSFTMVKGRSISIPGDVSHSSSRQLHDTLSTSKHSIDDVLDNCFIKRTQSEICVSRATKERSRNFSNLLTKTKSQKPTVSKTDSTNADGSKTDVVRMRSFSHMTHSANKNKKFYNPFDKTPFFKENQQSVETAAVLGHWKDILTNWDYHWHGLGACSSALNGQQSYSNFFRDSFSLNETQNVSFLNEWLVPAQQNRFSCKTEKHESGFLRESFLIKRTNTMLMDYEPLSSFSMSNEFLQDNPNKTGNFLTIPSWPLNTINHVIFLDFEIFRWLISGACRVSCKNVTSVKNVNDVATVSVEDISLLRPCIMGRICHYICYWYFDWNQEKRLLHKKTTTNFMKPVFDRMSGNLSDNGSKILCRSIPSQDIPNYGSHISRISDYLLGVWWLGLPDALRANLWLICFTNRAFPTELDDTLYSTTPRITNEKQPLCQQIFHILHDEIIKHSNHLQLLLPCPCQLYSGWFLGLQQTLIHTTRIYEGTFTQCESCCLMENIETNRKNKNFFNLCVSSDKGKISYNDYIPASCSYQMNTLHSVSVYRRSNSAPARLIISQHSTDPFSLPSFLNPSFYKTTVTNHTCFHCHEPLFLRKKKKCTPTNQLWFCAIVFLCSAYHDFLVKSPICFTSIIHLAAVCTSITTSRIVGLKLLHCIIFSTNLPVHDLLSLNNSESSHRTFVRFQLFQTLFSEKLPVLFKHFKTLQITPDFYLPVWFGQLFSGCMPIDQLVKVWDRIFLGGETIIFQVALGILHYHEVYLLTLTFKGCLRLLLQDFHQDLPLLETNLSGLKWHKELFDTTRLWRCIDRCRVNPVIVRSCTEGVHSLCTSEKLQQLLLKNSSMDS